MRMTYDPKADTLRILFCSAPMADTQSYRAGLTVDFDQDGKIVGLELASASQHISRIESIDVPGLILPPETSD